MKNKKGCGLGCFGCLSLVGSIFGLLMVVLGPVVTAGDEFLALLGQGKFTQAYQSSGSEFKKAIDEQGFTQIAKDAKLGEYASRSWGNRSMKNGVGELSGSFTTKGGTSYPISLLLTKEGDVWKVQQLNVNVPGLKVPEPGARSAPAASGTPETPETSEVGEASTP